MKYNYYWRKSGLKKPYGDNFLSLIEEYKPKNVLEIGVFCGVTSRNICELLKTNFGSDFRYYGLDLFGSTKTSSVDEIEPKFLENQKFSNPLKTIYYNFIKKENLNADVFGPLAFDNSISKKSAAIKGIQNSVAGMADVLLVPSVETGNGLVKMLIYFCGACAAGVVVGGKVPVVITSRSDEAPARLASIAAAVVALD